MRKELVNAQEMAQQNPDTFTVPTAEEMAAIEAGTYIKVCAEPERFWIRVESVNPDNTFTGRVEQSDMVFTQRHDYKHDDEVTVKPENIYSIYTK